MKLKYGTFFTFSSALTLHPSPFNEFVENINNLIAIPASEAGTWNSPLPQSHPSLDLLSPATHEESKRRLYDMSSRQALYTDIVKPLLSDPAFPSRLLKSGGRVILPTCSSLGGPTCAATEGSTLAEMLLTLRGPQDHSLYLQRLRSLLRKSKLAGLWIEDSGGHLKLRTLSEAESASLMEHVLTLPGNELSRILMAAEFESVDGGLYVPLLPEAVDLDDTSNEELPIEKSHPRLFDSSSKASDLRGANDAYRRWRMPGDPVDFADPMGWATILKESYSLMDIDKQPVFPSKLGAALGPGLSPKLLDKLALGIGWLKSSAFPADYIERDLQFGMLVDEPSIDKSMKVVEQQSYTPYTPPSSLAPELRNLVARETMLMELVPNTKNWKTYATLLKISPDGVRQWSRDMLRRKRTKRRNRMDPLLPVVKTQAARVKKLHPSSVAKGFVKAHVKVYRAIARLFVSAADRIAFGLAQLLGLDDDFETFVAKVHPDQARAPVRIVIPLSPEPSNETTSDKSVDDNEVESMMREYESVSKTYAHPVRYSRFAGTCWRWELREVCKALDSRVPPVFAKGLPHDYTVVWKGAWSLEDDVSGPLLRSAVGELHFEPSVVISELNLSLRNLTERAGQGSQIWIRGGKWRIPPGSNVSRETELERWRSNKVSNAMDTVFTLTLDPSVMTVDTGVTFNALKDAASRRGSFMKRIDVLHFALSRNAWSAGKAETRRRPPLWGSFPLASPTQHRYSIELSSMTIHPLARIWDLEHKLMTRLRDNIKDSALPEDLLVIPFEAKRRGNNYITSANSFPTILISTMTATREAEPVTHPVKAHTKLGRLVANRLLLHEQMRGNQSFFASSVKNIKFPLMPGEPISRGVGKISAAQLAPDADIRQGIEASLSGLLPSAGISGDGFPLHSDMRQQSLHVLVEATDIPIEAPIITFKMMRQYRLSSLYNHERVEQVSFAQGAVETETGQEDFLRVLQTNLEKSGFIKRYLSNFVSTVKGTGEAKEEVRDMWQGALNDILADWEAAGTTLSSTDDLLADQASLAYAEGLGVDQVPHSATSQSQEAIRSQIRQVIDEASRHLHRQGLPTPSLERVTLVTVVEDPETGRLHTQTVDVDLSVSSPEDPMIPTFSTPTLTEPEQETAVQRSLQEALPDAFETTTTTPFPLDDTFDDTFDDSFDAIEDELQGLQSFLEVASIWNYDEEFDDGLAEAAESVVAEIMAMQDEDLFDESFVDEDGNAVMDLEMEDGSLYSLTIPKALLEGDEDALQTFVEEELLALQNVTAL